MKEIKIIAVGLVLVSVLSAVPVRAEEDASPSPLKARVEARDEKLQEQREKAAERVQELKEKRENAEERKRTKNQERIEKFWGAMQKRLEVLIRNERRYVERIRGYLTQLGERGTDVRELTAKLDRAEVLITEAEEALAEAKTQIASIVSGNEPKDALVKVRDLNKAVLEKIRAAHRALVDVLTQAKQSRTFPSPTPTP